MQNDPEPALSRWTRWRKAADRFADALLDALLGSDQLSAKLPPKPSAAWPASAHFDHGEELLFAALRAPATRQAAAIVVLRWALAARREGEDSYLDFMVHLALSRLRPDSDDLIDVARLQGALYPLDFDRDIRAALIRLEEQAVVRIVRRPSDDPMAAIRREGITHVELRVAI